MRDYSRRQVMVANLPYAVMTLTGAAIIAAGLDLSVAGLGAAGAYAAYGIAGAFWIMAFVCPHCAFHGTRACPCGYGLLSAKFRPRGSENRFREKFRRHIPVIVPLWFIPAAVGGITLAVSFSWWLAGLVSAFALDAFVVLPIVSRAHSCSQCPQKDDCPWMGGKL